MSQNKQNPSPPTAEHNRARTDLIAELVGEVGKAKYVEYSFAGEIGLGPKEYVKALDRAIEIIKSLK